MIDHANTPININPEDEMARSARTSSPEPHRSLVAAYVLRLKTVGRSRDAFETLVGEMGKDARLVPADLIEIAVQFRGGGNRPSSRKAAIDVISKRFLELVRDHTKAAQAAKVRPW